MRSALTLSMRLFCFAMKLLCCAIVFLKFSMTAVTSSRAASRPSRLGGADSLVLGNGGSSCCVVCGAVCAAVGCSFCGDRNVVARTPSTY